MVVARSVVLTMFIGCVSFLMYSRSENPPEDCVKGKQYWSTSSVITSKGACVKCPRNWRTCFEQPIADQESCVRLCRVDPTTKPTPTTVIPLQPKHPTELNEGQKSHVFKENLGIVIWIAIGCCGLSVLILIIVAILLCCKIKKKPVGHRGEAGGIDAREQMVLQPLHPDRNDQELHEAPQHPLEINADDFPAGRTDEEEQIVLQEEELSTTRVGGIQDTEKQMANFSSSLNVDQNHY